MRTRLIVRFLIILLPAIAVFSGYMLRELADLERLQITYQSVDRHFSRAANLGHELAVELCQADGNTVLTREYASRKVDQIQLYRQTDLTVGFPQGDSLILQSKTTLGFLEAGLSLYAQSTVRKLKGESERALAIHRMEEEAHELQLILQNWQSYSPALLGRTNAKIQTITTAYLPAALIAFIVAVICAVWIARTTQKEQLTALSTKDNTIKSVNRKLEVFKNDLATSRSAEQQLTLQLADLTARQADLQNDTKRSLELDRFIRLRTYFMLREPVFMVADGFNSLNEQVIKGVKSPDKRDLSQVSGRVKNLSLRLGELTSNRQEEKRKAFLTQLITSTLASRGLSDRLVIEHRGEQSASFLNPSLFKEITGHIFRLIDEYFGEDHEPETIIIETGRNAATNSLSFEFPKNASSSFESFCDSTSPLWFAPEAEPRDLMFVLKTTCSEHGFNLTLNPTEDTEGLKLEWSE